MLGQPISMLVPQVVGLRLDGELPEGATATDLVLTIAELLREPRRRRQVRRVLRPGRRERPAREPGDDRQHVARVRLDGDDLPDRRRDASLPAPSPAARRAASRLVEAYAKEQGLWHDPTAEPVVLRDARARPVDGRAEPRRPGAAPGPGPARPGQADVRRGARAGRSPAERRRRERRAPRTPRRPSSSRTGPSFELDHGHVVIAAITSCTNTSNPQVMLAAGLLAKQAVERGLSVKPWVKTSLAPGSRVVMDYYERAGLTPYLEKLGFGLVGFGCTTCIGNSGPLAPEISAAIDEHGLACVAVLSGNRNFEGRIHPDVRMNYLASPPLVVAYALAGTMDIDLLQRAARRPDADGEPVFLARHVADARRGRRRRAQQAVQRRDVPRRATPTSSTGDERWQLTRGRRRGRATRGTTRRPTSAGRRSSTACGAEPGAAHRRRRRPGARRPRRQRDDRPHLAGGIDQADEPGRRLAPAPTASSRGRLQLLRRPPRQPRGDDPRHLRQHPHPQPPRARAPRAG